MDDRDETVHESDAAQDNAQDTARSLSCVAAQAERLDRALAAALPDFSRARIQSLIRDGQARVDGAVVTQASRKLVAGAQITLAVPPPVPATPEGEKIPLVIVHEDDDLIVIDKPAGLVVHPAGGHETGTLVNALIAHCGDTLSGIGGVARPGIVHRLDKDTSGLLVVAKNDAAHRGLAAQFADHGRTGPLERAYRALVWGAPERTRFTIEAPIARARHNREKMIVVETRRARVGEEPRAQGREAITHVAVEERFGAVSGDDPRDAHAARDAHAPRDAHAALLRCTLETGRTHQIRVHLAHSGHPLLGDALYGAGFRTKASLLPEAAQDALIRLDRQALHAALLGFAHPRTGETLRFESPDPPDLAALITALRGPQAS